MSNQASGLDGGGPEDGGERLKSAALKTRSKSLEVRAKI
jgi:hypothetical protein